MADRSSRKTSLGKQCAAFNCTSREYKNANREKVVTGYSFYTFPKEESLVNRWCELIKRENNTEGFVVRKHTVVCNRHFDPSMIYRPPGGTVSRLLPGALPVLHEWNGWKASGDAEVRVKGSRRKLCSDKEILIMKPLSEPVKVSERREIRPRKRKNTKTRLIKQIEDLEKIRAALVQLDLKLGEAKTEYENVLNAINKMTSNPKKGRKSTPCNFISVFLKMREGIEKIAEQLGKAKEEKENVLKEVNYVINEKSKIMQDEAENHAKGQNWTQIKTAPKNQNKPQDVTSYHNYSKVVIMPPGGTPEGHGQLEGVVLSLEGSENQSGLSDTQDQTQLQAKVLQVFRFDANGFQAPDLPCLLLQSDNELALASLPQPLEEPTASVSSYNQAESVDGNRTNIDAESSVQTQLDVEMVESVDVDRGSRTEIPLAVEMDKSSGSEKPLAVGIERGSRNGVPLAGDMERALGNEKSLVGDMERGSMNGVLLAVDMERSSGNEKSLVVDVEKGLGNETSAILDIKRGSRNDVPCATTSEANKIVSSKAENRVESRGDLYLVFHTDATPTLHVDSSSWPKKQTPDCDKLSNDMPKGTAVSYDSRDHLVVSESGNNNLGHNTVVLNGAGLVTSGAKENVGTNHLVVLERGSSCLGGNTDISSETKVGFVVSGEKKTSGTDIYNDTRTHLEASGLKAGSTNHSVVSASDIRCLSGSIGVLNEGKSGLDASDVNKDFPLVDGKIVDMRLLLRETREAFSARSKKKDTSLVGSVKAKLDKEKSYVCDECGASYTNRWCFLLHKRIHSGDSRYRCEHCGKQCTSGTKLEHHLRSHTGERPYKCTQCEATFTLSSNLKRHILTHSGEKPYKCVMCGKAYTQHPCLKIHMRSHTGERPYHCPKCPKRFASRRFLRNHLGTHAGEHIKDPLQVGEETIQIPLEKPFHCDTCGKKFSQKVQLTVHTRTHTGEKPYQCDVCSRAFAQKHALAVHMRRHSGEKPYNCDRCQASFASRANLRRHDLVHSGFKPFVCHVCGKTFGQKTQLQYHWKVRLGKNDHLEMPDSFDPIVTLSTINSDPSQPTEIESSINALLC